MCVYCGANPAAGPSYIRVAQTTGRALAERRLRLVCGGARIGMMGAVADGALASGGAVLAVVPEALTDRGVVHKSIPEIEVVRTFEDRKARMWGLADAVLALPGGFGTAEELLGALSRAQLGIDSKPCGLLNVDSYYDGLLSFLDHSVREGFLAIGDRSLLLVESDPHRLVDALCDRIL